MGRESCSTRMASPRRRTRKKEFYGIERLCVVVSEHWAQSADAIKDAVIADVRGFIGAQTVYDDLTLLVVKQQ